MRITRAAILPAGRLLRLECDIAFAVRHSADLFLLSSFSAIARALRKHVDAFPAPSAAAMATMTHAALRERPAFP